MQKCLHIQASTLVTLILILAFSGTGLSQEGPRARSKDLNAFACDLHRALLNPGSNLLISPYSITENLDILAMCTAGETHEELRKVLRYSLETQAELKAALTLRESLSAGQTGNVLHTANRLWLHSGAAPGYYDEDFVGRLLGQASSGCERIDFRETAKARQVINQWTNDRTIGRIPEILPEGVLDGMVRLVVTNAVAFKAGWAVAFDAKRTRPAKFKVSDSETVTVPMMAATLDVRTANFDEVSVIEIDYAGEEFAFVAMLPGEGKTLEDLEKGLTGDAFSGWMKGLERQHGYSVRIPKFKLATEYRLHERGLPELGMKRALIATRDWSNLVPNDDIGVSYIGHKAFMEVHEEGTEAAAATVSVAKRLGAPPKGFVADRPFLFAIVHSKTQSILFMGRMVRPL